MNELKDTLEILRQRIPIGLRHGQALLKKADGDLGKAEKQFVKEMIAVTISKTGVEPEVAFRHLTKNNFDIGLTIKSIDEERYTLTELILRKFKDKKEQALDEIAFAVEEKYNLKRNYFWLILDGLKDLPSEIYCFMTTMDWLNYESWEDFQDALSINLDIVTEQIEINLRLPGLANSLRQAGNIQRLVYEKNKDPANYQKASNQLRKNKDYQKCAQEFITQRILVIDRLYELVQNNIARFP